nr:immunoglobulin light chain junction region [Macaca mulatta]MPN86940.1 immunoglobulin light chain junction region [Macaca mulatta]MPN90221.1 immunoglobulin light chain junction region [Macaca mulatta]
GQQYDNFPF